jgi:hypothetical protein
MPFLVVSHAAFMVSFVDAWLGKRPDAARNAAAAVFHQWPQWSQHQIAGWLSSPKIPNRWLMLILLAPFTLSLIVFAPWESVRSALSSSWDILSKGVRGIPPLITAMIVVFVTSDAWRILGTGFTVRFGALVFVFVLTSVLFLGQHDCWVDIDAKPEEATALLDGIDHKNLTEIRALIDCGINPLPILKPRGLGALWVRASYWFLAAFALIVAAIFVSSGLILIGVILISRDETQALANSVYVYQTFPGGLVVTKQLLSLSFSLGAFAAFFLVAAQRPRDRREFMKHALACYRRTALVYSIYWRARYQAAEWTQVPPR